MIKKLLVFDMDGTIADLYGVDNWLPLLREQSTIPYEIAQPMYDMVELAEILNQLKTIGYRIVVTTWASMECDRDYFKRIRQAKLEWLYNQGFPFDELHCNSYGRSKRYATSPTMQCGNYPTCQILIDDNQEVRTDWAKWHGLNTIDANQDIIPILKQLLGE